jgi:Type I phosphodiesterase / nucleotide pyrophosphatase
MIRRPLADLLPSVVHGLGVPGYHARAGWLAGALGDPAPTQVVVLMADGLGTVHLDRHPDDAPVLTSMAELGPLTAPFPATTCVSLTSFGTGLPPGMHGIVGTTFRLDDGTTLAPLSWGAEPNPIATQPEPTVLERAEAAGVLVVSVAPAKHRMSGLTRAALRGGEYLGADTLDERVAAVSSALARGRGMGVPTLVYVYWPEVDKAAHVFGTDSPQLRAELCTADDLVGRLAGLLGSSGVLLVTADHGHVDVPDEHRFDLESVPALRVGVETILGEPRVRHVYTAAGYRDQVRATWARELAGAADVRTREEVVALLGPLDEWYADRVGDLVAIARDDWGLVSDRIDRLVSSLRGQHGALSDAEVLVPLRMARG